MLTSVGSLMLALQLVNIILTFNLAQDLDAGFLQDLLLLNLVSTILVFVHLCSSGCCQFAATDCLLALRELDVVIQWTQRPIS